MNIYSLSSNSQSLDGGAMFGNAPKALWNQWIPCDDENRIILTTQCILVDMGVGLDKYLFECGIGAFFEDKLKNRFGVLQKHHVLLESLQKLQISPDEITHIVLSHLHFDHAGGILEGHQASQQTPPKIVFKNAKIFISKEQMERAKNPHPRDKASFITDLMKQLENNPKVFLVEGPSHPELPSWIDFYYSQGHTPGLMISGIHFQEQNKKIYFPSDLIPGVAWIHVPISMGYDRFAELVIDEKRKFLQKVYEEKSYLFFVHDPKIVACQIDFQNGKFIPLQNSERTTITGSLT